MKKLERVITVSLVLSMLGVVLFWVFGFNANEEAAVYSFFASGFFGLVSLGALAIRKLRTRGIYY